MNVLLFVYYIACYSIGAAGLAISLAVSIARPSKLERAYLSFMLGFTAFIVSMTVAAFLLSSGEPDRFALSMAALANITGCCLIIPSLARLSELLVAWRGAKAFRVLFAALGAVSWVLAMTLYFTSAAFWGQLVMLASLFAVIMYATVGGLLSDGGTRNMEVPDEERGRWDRMMKKIRWIALAFAPLFAIIDFFPAMIPGLLEALSPVFKVAPAFYAIWNAIYIVGALPLLARPAGSVATERASEVPETASFDLSPREMEVAIALADGKSYKEIAHELGISLATVKTHAIRVYQKTGSGTKIDLLKKLYPNRPKG